MTDVPPPHPRARESMAAAIQTQAALVSAALVDLRACTDVLALAATRMLGTLQSGHKIMVAGNGGSAAEAQHFAAELVGRFQRERSPYAALALTTDTSILTAVANDYSYDDIFARQIAALGREGDLFLAYSTSGRSRNLMRAVETARERNIVSVAVTGSSLSPLGEAADLTIRTPGAETPIVQQLHTVMTHLLCDFLETRLAEPEAPQP